MKKEPKEAVKIELVREGVAKVDFLDGLVTWEIDYGYSQGYGKFILWIDLPHSLKLGDYLLQDIKGRLLSLTSHEMYKVQSDVYYL